MELRSFFEDHPAGALAFSGGTDSALLVWAAAQYGSNWHAYYVKTPFQPLFELNDAETIAALCDLPLHVIEADPLADPAISSNPSDRCYYCKHLIFRTIARQAAADGHSLLIDGTNASDLEDDRPGMKALRELSVRSPLRECGITKAEVRRLSREAGLPTWNKPAYACLATRIPTGTAITREDLVRIERGEALLHELGLRDFRLRLRGEAALLQFTEASAPLVQENQAEIFEMLSPLFSQVHFDSQFRKPSD